MLRLLLVKDEQDSEIQAQENNEGFPRGTAILKYLKLPWSNSEQGVCADFYFVSVSSAEKITQLHLQFIGVVKTVTKTFLINYLPGI